MNPWIALFAVLKEAVQKTASWERFVKENPKPQENVNSNNFVIQRG